MQIYYPSMRGLEDFNYDKLWDIWISLYKDIA